jgi:pyrophosphate--fructose-6-phosphate 1-phosphotransferase
MPQFSPLQNARADYKPRLPAILNRFNQLHPLLNKECASTEKNQPIEISTLFPHSCNQKKISFSTGTLKTGRALRVGVVLSGGQASGGHNVISGLYDALQKIDPKCELIGFMGGPAGIIENKTMILTDRLIALYRNQGGFDMIGSGRTKIETPDQFEKSLETVKKLNLDGLVVVGGDDSNTNAALLAEFFLSRGCKTTVVGVPKTIDGDLKNEEIEVSFGCDTACKTYSEIIGNIARDCLSAKKYYFFIKLMGRSASHVTLECALQTHPNMAFIGEEVAKNRDTFAGLTKQLADMIEERSNGKKDYGVVLISEGIIEFIPEFNTLIKELNTMLAEGSTTAREINAIQGYEKRQIAICGRLSAASKSCFESIPAEIQRQLLLDRDPHGNVQVSKIETERLFISAVEKELEKRKFTGKFSAQPLFFGYEGRSCYPSNFDANYCYSLGHVAALLIESNLTGYMACVKNLTASVEEWTIAGIPITSLMRIEMRHGKAKPVIEKAMVDLEGAPFQRFAAQRTKWELHDEYRFPGPIQFFGPEEITDTPMITLQLEQAGKKVECSCER